MASPQDMRARQCIWPNRVQHCFVYGLVFRFRLLSTPPLNDAVTFRYGQASVPVRKGLSPFCRCVLSGAPLSPLRAAAHVNFRGPLSRFIHSSFIHPGVRHPITDGVKQREFISSAKAAQRFFQTFQPQRLFSRFLPPTVKFATPYLETEYESLHAAVESRTAKMSYPC